MWKAWEFPWGWEGFLPWRYLILQCQQGEAPTVSTGAGFWVQDPGIYLQFQSLRQAFALEVRMQNSCQFFGKKVAPNLPCSSIGHRDFGWCGSVLGDKLPRCISLLGRVSVADG